MQAPIRTPSTNISNFDNNSNRNFNNRAPQQPPPDCYNRAPQQPPPARQTHQASRPINRQQTGAAWNGESSSSEESEDFDDDEDDFQQSNQQRQQQLQQQQKAQALAQQRQKLLQQQQQQLQKRQQQQRLQLEQEQKAERERLEEERERLEEEAQKKLEAQNLAVHRQQQKIRQQQRKERQRQQSIKVSVSPSSSSSSVDRHSPSKPSGRLSTQSNESLDLALSRADDVATQFELGTHKSQVRVDEGSETEIPSWRLKEIKQREEEEDEEFEDDDSKPAQRYKLKKRQTSEAKIAVLDFLDELELLEDDLTSMSHHPPQSPEVDGFGFSEDSFDGFAESPNNKSPQSKTTKELEVFGGFDDDADVDDKPIRLLSSETFEGFVV